MNNVPTEVYMVELKKMQERIDKLEDAIRRHRDAAGHELCWQNDYELYSVLGESEVDKRDTLPPREEFLERCESYYESRLLTLAPPKIA